MAIIPDVPHVTVDIVVDGRPLPEYLDEDDADSVSPDSITKYIESVSGSHFSIQVNLSRMERRHLKRGNGVVVEYYLDGQWAAGNVYRFPLRANLISVVPGARRKENGTWIERKFLFTNLVTSEDAACNKARPELQDLGTITVKLHYAHVQGSPNFHSSDFSKISMHEDIHEKHLKGQAISQQVKLGEAVPAGALSTLDSRLLEEFAVFNFRYRSHRDLQTLCLIPRSPSPIPLEDRPQEDLNREELLELLRRQKARQEEQVAIKEEHKRERIENDEDDDELTIISSRPPAKQLRISTDADTGIDTIDLTDV